VGKENRMDLLFIIDFAYDVRNYKFTETQAYPSKVRVLDAVIDGLSNGFPSRLPINRVVVECWGDLATFGDHVNDTTAFRKRFSQLAAQPLGSIDSVPKNGPPPELTTINVELEEGKGKWHLAIYGGNRDDCEPRVRYCYWVLDSRKPQPPNRLTSAIERVEGSLADLTTPKGFLACIKRMDKMLVVLEDYFQQRIDRLEPCIEHLDLSDRDRTNVRQWLRELRKGANRVSRNREVLGSSKQEILSLNWQEFFDTFMPLTTNVPHSVLVELLQEYLDLQTGKRVGPLKEGKAFARAVTTALNAVQQRLVCPGVRGVDCQSPATLRCKITYKGDKEGSFYFGHFDGEVPLSHGFSREVPQMVLTPMPAGMAAVAGRPRV
jgi:hypothetical protein